MKKINFWLILIFTLCISQVSFAHLIPNKQVTQKEQLLFVVVAKEGQISLLKGKKNTYQLVLSKVDPAVIYFANHPQRYSGEMSIHKFLKAWQSGGDFASNPPNAVMQAIRLYANHQAEKKHSVSYAIVLQNPQYLQSKDTLIFNINPLKGNITKIPEIAKSDYVALFIDACGACWGN